MAGEKPNIVIYDGNTIIDLTPTTAVESDVVAGKVFFKSDGAQAVGDILNGDWVEYGAGADTEPIVGLGLVGYMVLGDEGSASPVVGTGKVGQMKII